MSPMLKLILEDGRPLDAGTAKKVEAELEKTRAQRKQKLFHQSIRWADRANWCVCLTIVCLTIR